MPSSRKEDRAPVSSFLPPVKQKRKHNRARCNGRSIVSYCEAIFTGVILGSGFFSVNTQIFWIGLCLNQNNGFIILIKNDKNAYLCLGTLGIHNQKCYLINRPGVAREVLQSTLSLIY